MKNTESLTERNNDITRMYREDKLTLAQIGKLYDISKQRVSFIINKKTKKKKSCNNCYHHLLYCACREKSDMISNGKCPDWHQQ